MKTQKDMKEDVYEEMAAMARDYLSKHRRLVSRDLMKDMYMAVIRSQFKALFELGKYQFPAGLGSLRTKRMATTRRRHPVTGELFTVRRARMTVRYSMGVALKQVMGYKDEYTYKAKRGYKNGLAGITKPPVVAPPPGV